MLSLRDGGEGLSDREQPWPEEILPEPSADDVALRGQDSEELATVEADPEAQFAHSRQRSRPPAAASPTLAGCFAGGALPP